MNTIITDNTGRTWKRAVNPEHRAAGYWYSSAGTMSTLQQLQQQRGPLTVTEQRSPETFSIEEIRRYIVPTHNNNK